MTRLACITLALSLAWSLAAVAEDGGPVAPTDEVAEQGLRVDWSATLMGQYKYIAPPDDDDGVGGFFDQYEFTPNKSSPFPFELGIRDGALDLFRDVEDAVFQARLESPTSNLGVSGSQVDQPFFNQRLDTVTRLEWLDIDLEYRRMRTEQLRLFPNTEGPGLVFQDGSQPNDRFYRDRTGVYGEARLRLYDAIRRPDPTDGWFVPELSVRGGYEGRGGLSQLRIHRGPSNDWLGLAQNLDRSVSDVGVGLLVAPKGLLTVTFDFDHERFRFDSSPITDGDLGYPPPGSTRSIAFVPETDRSTGTLRLSSRLGNRAVFEGGFQLTHLAQTDAFTPNQITAGLRDNEVTYYSANAVLDLRLIESLSFNTTFKFDRRNNGIQRDTALFDPSNGSQVDPFVKYWRRYFVEGELEWRLRGANRLAFGVRYEDVFRELETAAPGNRRVLPENAQIDDRTRIVTVYGRAASRPWRQLGINAELGFAMAPDTGYIVELDDHVYGSLRASYLFSIPRPLVVSAFVKGGTGKNEDFVMVSGQGPSPAGPFLPRSYDRSDVAWGLTASMAPIDRLSVFASFFCGRDFQDTSLDGSSLQRYYQDQAPIDFATQGKNRFQNEQKSFILGSHYQITERTDGGISYAFTQAQAVYDGSSTSTFLDWIATRHIVDSNIHGLDFEVGHWVMDGLRVLAGYRLQLLDDDAPLFASDDSVVAPFDRSTQQHAVTLGITLTSELFRD